MILFLPKNSEAVHEIRTSKINFSPACSEKCLLLQSLYQLFKCVDTSGQIARNPFETTSVFLSVSGMHYSFSALTLLVGQEKHPTIKNPHTWPNLE